MRAGRLDKKEGFEVGWYWGDAGVFKETDHDNNGFVDREELHEMTAMMGHTLDDDQMTGMIQNADSDGDGRVNRDELHRMLVDGSDATDIPLGFTANLFGPTPQPEGGVPLSRALVALLSTSPPEHSYLLVNLGRRRWSALQKKGLVPEAIDRHPLLQERLWNTSCFSDEENEVLMVRE